MRGKDVSKSSPQSFFFLYYFCHLRFLYPLVFIGQNGNWAQVKMDPTNFANEPPFEFCREN